MAGRELNIEDLQKPGLTRIPSHALRKCGMCGAAVLDKELHDGWHRFLLERFGITTK